MTKAEYAKQWRLDHPARIKEWRQANTDKIRAQKRIWCKANPEKVAGRNKKYREVHGEELRIKKGIWYEANAEEIGIRRKSKYDPIKNRIQCQKYRDVHPEEAKIRTKEWRMVNPEKVKEWLMSNPEKTAAQAAKRRALKLRAAPPWINSSEFLPFYEEAKKLTIQTGISHVVDHIIPLKNHVVCGLHVPWNLQVITAMENGTKNNHFNREEASASP